MQLRFNYKKRVFSHISMRPKKGSHAWIMWTPFESILLADKDAPHEELLKPHQPGKNENIGRFWKNPGWKSRLLPLSFWHPAENRDFAQKTSKQKLELKTSRRIETPLSPLIFLLWNGLVIEPLFSKLTFLSFLLSNLSISSVLSCFGFASHPSLWQLCSGCPISGQVTKQAASRFCLAILRPSMENDQMLHICRTTKYPNPLGQRCWQYEWQLFTSRFRPAQEDTTTDGCLLTPLAPKHIQCLHWCLSNHSSQDPHGAHPWLRIWTWHIGDLHPKQWLSYHRAMHHLQPHLFQEKGTGASRVVSHLPKDMQKICNAATRHGATGHSSACTAPPMSGKVLAWSSRRKGAAGSAATANPTNTGGAFARPVSFLTSCKQKNNSWQWDLVYKCLNRC